jgi:FkbM family methyltransferase
MINSHNFWFPDYDTHFPKMLAKSLAKDGVARYQWRARDAAIALCDQRRTCLDIGANVGLWSCDLVSAFSHVIAFEPVLDFIECYKKNVNSDNYTMHNVALGNVESFITMNVVEGNTGHSHVDPLSLGNGNIPLKRLDSFEFDNVDLIKIDVEGYEEEILKGAMQTIMRNKPVLVIEQQKHEYKNDMDALPCIKVLESWGYKVIEQFNKDWILKI